LLRASLTSVSVAVTVLSLVACSPSPRTLEICKSRTEAEVQGKRVTADDVSELIEACMLQRGWALKEDGRRCSDTAATPQKLGCYYKDNFWGRMYLEFLGG